LQAYFTKYSHLASYADVWKSGHRRNSLLLMLNFKFISAEIGVTKLHA